MDDTQKQINDMLVEIRNLRLNVNDLSEKLANAYKITGHMTTTMEHEACETGLVISCDGEGAWHVELDNGDEQYTFEPYPTAPEEVSVELRVTRPVTYMCDISVRFDDYADYQEFKNNPREYMWNYTTDLIDSSSYLHEAEELHTIDEIEFIDYTVE